MPEFQGEAGPEEARIDLKMDYIWLGVTMALVIFGIIMIYSASAHLAARRYHNSFYFVQKQLAFAFFGFLAMIAFRFVPYQKFKKWVYNTLFQQPLYQTIISKNLSRTKMQFIY